MAFQGFCFMELRDLASLICFLTPEISRSLSLCDEFGSAAELSRLPCLREEMWFHARWLSSSLSSLPTQHMLQCFRFKESSSAEEPHLQVPLPLAYLNTAREYPSSLHSDCPCFTADSWRNSLQESCFYKYISI